VSDLTSFLDDIVEPFLQNNPAHLNAGQSMLGGAAAIASLLDDDTSGPGMDGASVRIGPGAGTGGGCVPPNVGMSDVSSLGVGVASVLGSICFWRHEWRHSTGSCWRACWLCVACKPADCYAKCRLADIEQQKRCTELNKQQQERMKVMRCPGTTCKTGRIAKSCHVDVRRRERQSC